jgi:hypothetical protein
MDCYLSNYINAQMAVSRKALTSIVAAAAMDLVRLSRQ